MAATQQVLSEKFSEEGNDDYAERCQELAEQALPELLAY